MMDMYSGQIPFLLLCLGLLLVQLLHGALGITITNTISNSRPRLGETITLECNIKDGNPTEVSWYKDRHINTKAMIIAFNCLVVPKEYKTRFTKVKCDANNYNFQLSDVQIKDRGQWECEADGESATNKLQLDVLVPPLIPTVTNPSPVKVGDNGKFTCNAENENVTKPVTYTWTKNGNTVSPRTVEPGALLFSSVKKSDAGKYACVATNDAGDKTSTEQDFVIYYAPDSVKLKTTTASNSKSESETETFTCEAIGGNPVPLVKLIRQVGSKKETLIEENNRDVIFNRQMMRQDNQVKFYCEATGPGIPNQMTSSLVTYNVLFAPNTVQLTEIPQGHVSQNSTKDLICQGGSASNPKAMIEWQKVLNGKVTFPESLTVEENMEEREYYGVKVMSTVSLDTTKANNGAVYKCLLVYNGKQTINLQHQVTMDIRFRPTNIVLSESPYGAVLENSQKMLTCETSSSNKPSSIIWKKYVSSNKGWATILGGVQQLVVGEYNSRRTVSTLLVQTTREQHLAQYLCQARYQNSLLSIKQTTALIIYFPHNVQVKVSKTTVNEHEFVRFECDTSGGNPAPIKRYQWLWKKSGSTKEQVIQDTETSTQNGKYLEFTRIPYDKSGTYSCKAWNDGGMGQASTVLNVQYSPRIDPETKMKYDVAGEMGKEAMFELFIIANPTPVTTGYTWSKDGNVISRTSPDYEIISGPTSSKLKIKNVKSSDYKNYTCSVRTSGFQAKVFKFKLLKAGPPSAPSNLTVVNSTAVAATLEWVSEFPGGSEQKFYVQYKTSEENWNIASEVPPGGIADPGLKKAVSHKVMNLKSNVWYVFRVRSKNSHPGPHTSNFSNIAPKKTPEAPQTSVLSVSRTDKDVTVRWKQVTGKYTSIKVKYCETGTEDCMDYLVEKPKENYATFFVDADKTYYYYMIIEDGGDVVYRSNPLVDDDKTNTGGVATGNIGMITGIVGGGVALILVVIIVIAIILRKKKPSKKKREAQEMQKPGGIYKPITANGSTSFDVHSHAETSLSKKPTPAIRTDSKEPNCRIIDGKVKREPVIYENEPVWVRRSDFKVNLQKPDVVSHTQRHVENPYQNVPVSQNGSQNGSRPPSVASRPSRPGSRAEENPYQNVNVNRNSQPQRYSGSGGVPQPIGVDGTVYAELSFHGARNPAHPQYNYPIRRTEEFAPYATVDFSRKAPPMNVEYTV
ncbi:hemicentin-1-like isoform X2 [Lineus longissimus]|uniref:hemicentin-1-like isoform X2 n=1 Tax=Lineus longissimus TaxID=88925 RepID=UPI00315CC90A